MLLVNILTINNEYPKSRENNPIAVSYKMAGPTLRFCRQTFQVTGYNTR